MNENITYALIIGVVALMAFNQIQLFSLSAGKGNNVAAPVAAAGTASSGSPSINASSGMSADAMYAAIMPRGTPRQYGAELGVSFDNPEAAIAAVGKYDTSISLSGNLLQRYINVAGRISCEYCCGAESIIFTNGQAACGCAHSGMMRGLAKYLLKNHAADWTDDQLLEELGKWKTTFFPKQITQKAMILAQNGIDLNYINLASNKYRDLSKLQETKAAGTGSGLSSVPNMVGGC